MKPRVASWCCTVGLATVITTACERSTSGESDQPIAIDGLTVVVDGLTATLTGNTSSNVDQVTIDWGDASESTISTGLPAIIAEHEYAAADSYTVAVEAIDDDGASARFSIVAAVVDPATESSAPTTSAPSSTSSTTSTTTTTTTTVAATTTSTSTTTTTTTTVAPTTTTTTTTTTLPPEPITLDLTNATGGGGVANTDTVIPFRVAVASWWSVGNLHTRAAIGPGGTGESPIAEAWLYTDFTADASDATIRYTVDWDGTLTGVVAANSYAGVDLEIAVYEVSGTTQGARIAHDVVLSEALSAEAIQGVQAVTLADSASGSFPLTLTPGARYRVRLDLRCEARALFTLSVVDCGFGTNDLVDTGNGAGWSNVTVTFQPDV